MIIIWTSKVKTDTRNNTFIPSYKIPVTIFVKIDTELITGAQVSIIITILTSRVKVETKMICMCNNNLNFQGSNWNYNNTRVPYK